MTKSYLHKGLDRLRLQDMDAGGIDLQVLSDIGSNLELHSGDEGVQLAREANDQVAAAIAAHPDRFAGFATLPMTEPGAAADELERAVRQLRLQGAMLFSTTNGRFLDDPAFLPVLERAAALSVPIYLHPAFPPASVREAWTRRWALVSRRSAGAGTPRWGYLRCG